MRAASRSRDSRYDSAGFIEDFKGFEPAPPDTGTKSLKASRRPKKLESSKGFSTDAARDKARPRSARLARPAHDEIARRAYDLFLREGANDGRALDHWLMAEQELLGGASDGRG